MGHELSSKYDMTHGATLALLTPSWMRHTMRTAPEHMPVFAQFARNVFDIREDDDPKAAEEGVKKLEEFYSSIKNAWKTFALPVLVRKTLDFMAEKAVENGNLGILT